jgi:pyruvate/2-oxoglutarate dehydrogenase complex dihydrolipoamide dehydrogenase (E3) component
VAAGRGHRVTLWEKSDKLGGTLSEAIVMPHKEGIARLVQYYVRQMEILGVTVELGKEVTPEAIEKIHPDVLILAVGAEPIRLGLPGANLPHVFLAKELLERKASLGRLVAIIGGGLVGAEIAEMLADQGKEVMVVEQLDSVATQAGFIVRKELLKSLCHKGVKILVGTKALAITGEGVLVERFGEKEVLKADSIILAIGYQSRNELVKNLDVGQMVFYRIGDCIRPRMIMEAIEEGNGVGFAI